MDSASMLVDLCSNLERDMRRLAWVCQGMADLAGPMREARDKGDVAGLERLGTMFAKLSDEYQAVRMTYTGKVGQA